MLAGIPFLLKKIISYWLMPMPAGLALAALGWWLLRFPRAARLGRRLVGAVLLLVLVLGNRLVSIELLRPLESRYPAIPELRAGEPPPAALAACRYVVVLGGGHTDDPALPALGKLSTSALGRVTEAVRLLRVLPAARLIVSGPGDPGRPTHAEVLAESAESLGVSPDRILLISDARDTGDESRAVKAIVGSAPVALVTSAWHMPRAEGLFVAAGVDALPCPADSMAKLDPGLRLGDLGWDVESLERSTWAAHEGLGILWNRLRTGLGVAR
jgi:uncharacterized SAM-binding protein YcdF (DUF218 family)